MHLVDWYLIKNEDGNDSLSRVRIRQEEEVDKLSVVSDIDEKGTLKTAPAEEAQQSSFLRFSNKDGLLKNFMTNFLKQFNEPKRFGLYKVLASNVEQGVNNLKETLQNREAPENKQQLEKAQAFRGASNQSVRD